MRTARIWSISALALGLLLWPAEATKGDTEWTRSSRRVWNTTLSDRVGIGTTTPGYPLHVVGKCISGTNCVASGEFAAIGGGGPNTASSSWSTVAGGRNNTASKHAATVGGGAYNTASGQHATVCGGCRNTAAGDFSFAAGSRACANHTGTFVWADSTSVVGFASTGSQQFLIRAVGGVGIGTNNPGGYRLAVNGPAAKPGGGSWSNFSDGRLKTLGDSYQRGLCEVTRLNPVLYSYKESNALELPAGKDYVGLVAQDVQMAIPEAVEENRDGYLMVNNDPIIWAMVNAIKELDAGNRELTAENNSLRQDNDSLRQDLGTLTHRLEALERAMGQHKPAVIQQVE